MGMKTLSRHHAIPRGLMRQLDLMREASIVSAGGRFHERRNEYRNYRFRELCE